MSGNTRENSSGLPLFHLRRIGPLATKTGVVDVMDFLKVTYMIGRNPTQVDYVIDSSDYMKSAYISRNHARIVRQKENNHRLFDDSLNGVFVNNVKIAGSIVLQEGDRVTFGHPVGSKLKDCARVRQPDSEYQFIFETCSCVVNSESDSELSSSDEFSVPQASSQSSIHDDSFRRPKTPPSQKKLTVQEKCLRKEATSVTKKAHQRKATETFSLEDLQKMIKARSETTTKDHVVDTEPQIMNSGNMSSSVDNNKMDEDEDQSSSVILEYKTVGTSPLRMTEDVDSINLAANEEKHSDSVSGHLSTTTSPIHLAEKQDLPIMASSSSCSSSNTNVVHECISSEEQLTEGTEVMSPSSPISHDTGNIDMADSKCSPLETLYERDEANIMSSSSSVKNAALESEVCESQTKVRSGDGAHKLESPVYENVTGSECIDKHDSYFHTVPQTLNSENDVNQRFPEQTDDHKHESLLKNYLSEKTIPPSSEMGVDDDSGQVVLYERTSVSKGYKIHENTDSLMNVVSHDSSRQNKEENEHFVSEGGIINAAISEQTVNDNTSTHIMSPQETAVDEVNDSEKLAYLNESTDISLQLNMSLSPGYECSMVAPVLSDSPSTEISEEDSKVSQDSNTVLCLEHHSIIAGSENATDAAQLEHTTNTAEQVHALNTSEWEMNTDFAQLEHARDNAELEHTTDTAEQELAIDTAEQEPAIKTIEREIATNSSELDSKSNGRCRSVSEVVPSSQTDDDINSDSDIETDNITVAVKWHKSNSIEYCSDRDDSDQDNSDDESSASRQLPSTKVSAVAQYESVKLCEARNDGYRKKLDNDCVDVELKRNNRKIMESYDQHSEDVSQDSQSNNDSDVASWDKSEFQPKVRILSLSSDVDEISITSERDIDNDVIVVSCDSSSVISISDSEMEIEIPQASEYNSIGKPIGTTQFKTESDQSVILCQEKELCDHEMETVIVKGEETEQISDDVPLDANYHIGISSVKTENRFEESPVRGTSVLDLKPSKATENLRKRSSYVMDENNEVRPRKRHCSEILKGEEMDSDQRQPGFIGNRSEPEDPVAEEENKVDREISAEDDGIGVPHIELKEDYCDRLGCMENVDSISDDTEDISVMTCETETDKSDEFSEKSKGKLDVEDLNETPLRREGTGSEAVDESSLDNATENRCREHEEDSNKVPVNGEDDDVDLDETPLLEQDEEIESDSGDQTSQNEEILRTKFEKENLEEKIEGRNKDSYTSSSDDESIETKIKEGNEDCYISSSDDESVEKEIKRRNEDCHTSSSDDESPGTEEDAHSETDVDDRINEGDNVGKKTESENKIVDNCEGGLLMLMDCVEETPLLKQDEHGERGVDGQMCPSENVERNNLEMNFTEKFAKSSECDNLAVVDDNEKLRSLELTCSEDDSSKRNNSFKLDPPENEKVGNNMEALNCEERKREADDQDDVSEEEDLDRTSSLEGDASCDDGFDVEASLFENEIENKEYDKKLSDIEEDVDTNTDSASPSEDEENVSDDDDCDVDDPTEPMEGDVDLQGDVSASHSETDLSVDSDGDTPNVVGEKIPNLSHLRSDKCDEKTGRKIDSKELSSGSISENFDELGSKDVDDLGFKDVHEIVAENSEMSEKDSPSSPTIEFQGNEDNPLKLPTVLKSLVSEKSQHVQKSNLEELSCTFDDEDYSPIAVVYMDSLESDEGSNKNAEEESSQEDIFAMNTDDSTEAAETFTGIAMEPSTSVGKQYENQGTPFSPNKRMDEEFCLQEMDTDEKEMAEETGPSMLKYAPCSDSDSSRDEQAADVEIQPSTSKLRKRDVDEDMIMSPAKRVKKNVEVEQMQTKGSDSELPYAELTDTQLVNTPKLETKLKQKILESKSTSSKEKARMILERLKAKREKFLSVKKEPGSPTSVNNSQETPGDVKSSIVQRRILSSAADITLDNVNDYVGRCRDIIKGVDKLFRGPAHLQHNPRVKAWINELDEIRKRLDLPKTVIAVVGDTGAGKSSLMNAILDHVNVLPTSGMRACTAVVVEVTNNTKNATFEADIEFLSEKEWYDELELLLQELTGPDGIVKNRQPDPKSDAGVAYSKVRSVYGRADQFEVLKRIKNITKWLGKIKPITATNPTKFQQLIDRYIESTDTGTGGQYWPIVKHVRLRIPNCDVCSSGAVLVDLPGVRDSNAARDKIAREYLKNCTAVWVVSSIHRAIDDKTAKDLLGENFRRQLLMDGQYGTIAFICTKTDVLTPSEIIRSLDLEEQSKPLEDEIMQMEVNQMGTNKQIRCLKKEIKASEGEIRMMTEEISEIRGDLEEALSLLEPDGADSENHDEESQMEELKADLNKREQEAEEKKQEVSAKSKEKHALERKVLELDRQTQQKRRSLVALCAKARNDYSKTQIKKDFRAGLREMKRKAGLVREDDEEEDLYEPEDEEDSEEIGNYVDNLKVFCVSSTEYQKMKNLLTNDGPPQVFSSEEETQIPEIKSFVHEMTSVRKMQGTERLIRTLGRFLFDLDSYISDEGTSNRGTRMGAKSAFDVHISKLKDKMEPILSDALEAIQEVFHSSLQPKLEEGVLNANEEAPAVGAKWSLPLNREDRKSGGLHFSTYRATVRRDGAYKSPTAGPIDFNEDLVAPIYSSISISWDQIFNGLLWKTLDGCKGTVLNALKTFVLDLSEELHALSVQSDRIRRVNSQFLITANNKLTDIITHIREFTSERQRDISRLLTPSVQISMSGVYSECSSESGVGTYSRIKERISKAIEHNRFVMFDEASRLLLKEIDRLEKEIVEKMRVVCLSLCEDLKAAFEPLWEAPTNTKILRDAFLSDVKDFSKIARKLFEDAKIKEEIEKNILPNIPVPEVGSEVTVSSSKLDIPSAMQSIDQKSFKLEPESTCVGYSVKTLSDNNVQCNTPHTTMTIINPGTTLLRPSKTIIVPPPKLGPDHTTLTSGICKKVYLNPASKGADGTQPQYVVVKCRDQQPFSVVSSTGAATTHLVDSKKIKSEVNVYSLPQTSHLKQQNQIQQQKQTSLLKVIQPENRLKQLNEGLVKCLNAYVMDVTKCMETLTELECLPLSSTHLKKFPDILKTVKQCTKFKQSYMIKQKATVLYNQLCKILFTPVDENVPVHIQALSKSTANPRSELLSTFSSLPEDKPVENTLSSPVFSKTTTKQTSVLSNSSCESVSQYSSASSISAVASHNLHQSANYSASPKKSRLSVTKRKLLSNQEPSSDLPSLLSPGQIKREPQCEFSNSSSKRKRRKLDLGTIDLTEEND